MLVLVVIAGKKIGTPKAFFYVSVVVMSGAALGKSAMSLGRVCSNWTEQKWHLVKLDLFRWVGNLIAVGIFFVSSLAFFSKTEFSSRQSLDGGAAARSNAKNEFCRV